MTRSLDLDVSKKTRCDSLSGCLYAKFPKIYRSSFDECVTNLTKQNQRRRRRYRRKKSHPEQLSSILNWNRVQSALSSCTEPVYSGSEAMNSLVKRLNKGRIRPFFLVRKSRWFSVWRIRHKEMWFLFPKMLPIPVRIFKH